MANIVTVPDAYASVVARLISVGRHVPIEVISSDAAAGTWASVLVVGAASGGTNPVLSTGDALRFGDPAVASLDYNGGIRCSVAASVKMLLEASAVTVYEDIRWSNSVASANLSIQGTGGQSLTIYPSSGGVTGGDVTVRGGQGTTTGGDLFLQSGQGSTGGSVYIDVGAATTPGSVWIRDSGNLPRIRANDNGVGFNGGTPANAPSVTGSRGGNAALASLLTALEAMGLITDNTT